MIISNNPASSAHYLLLIISALLYLPLLILITTWMHLDATNVTVFIFIGLGGLIIFYFLRRDPILALYYWVVLLWPYIFDFDDHPIRTSYMVVPLLGFLIFLTLIKRPDGIRVYKNQILLMTILYTLVIFTSSILNMNYITGASYSFIILWSCGVLFFLMYSAHVNYFSEDKLLHVGENIFRVILAIAVISVAIGVLEYSLPDTIHSLYSPSGGEELWGSRESMRDWLININRVGSIIGGPNSFAAFLNIAAIISLSYALIHKKYYFLLLFLFFLLSSLLLSTSRGGILSLVLTALLMSLYLRKHLFLLCLLTISLIGIWIFPSSTNILQAGFVAASIDPSTTLPAAAERKFFITESLRTLAANPIHFPFGYGPSNNLMLLGIGAQGAHNIIFTNLHFYGFAGLILILLITGSLFRCLLYLSKRALRLRFFALTSLFIFLNLVIHSFVDDVFYLRNPIMWIVFPLIAVIVNLMIKESSYEKKNRIHNNH